MELLHELVATAFFAVFFSFLIAKLVSMAMAGGDCFRNSQISASPNVYQNIAGDTTTEEIQYRERLQVDKFMSEERVDFVADETRFVDKFLEGSIVDEKIEKSVKSDEVIEAECCEFLPKSIEEISSKDNDSLEVISGSGVGEFQVNREFGGNIPEDRSAIIQPEEVIDEQETGACDNLLVQNAKIATELSVANNNTEESQEVQDERSDAQEKADEKKIEIDIDDDDWEGIERSELENLFAKATKFVADEKLTNAGSYVQMELYGLHKVATEGPCREQAPMPLKVAARAKWNAWQRLGNMSPEVAMEQYVALVSDNIPGWKEDMFVGDGKPEPLEVATVEVVASDTNVPSHNPDYTEQSKNAEDISCTAKNNLTGGLILESLAKE